jgi:probable rRNA maturation factor
MILTVIPNRYQLKNDYLEKVAKAAFSLLPRKEGIIELSFVSESRIKTLNKEYRALDRVTDVLSFKINDNPLTGQVFICYNKAKEQAESYGKIIDEEVALLLVHGILHIFGFDHLDEGEAVKMEEMEGEILKLRGINR